jgi:hypothetical protein
MVTTAAETVKEIVRKVASEFNDLTSVEIGSKEYVSKVSAIDEQVKALAHMHPRWSEEQGNITEFTSNSDYLTEKEDDPLFAVFELSEDLLWSWREMNASHPTFDSMTKGMRLFVASLNALLRETDNI